MKDARPKKGAIMNKLTELLTTLARESGGGGNSLQYLEPQEIAGVALFLRDGRVAVLPLEGVAADG